MDFKLSEEQQLLLESLQELCRREITEDEVKKWVANGDVSDKFIRAYFDAGFGLLGVPEEYGGTPVDTLTMMLVAQHLHKYSGVYMQITSTVLTLYDIIHFGTPEQIKTCLDIYLETGRSPFSIVISEPAAGSDNQSMTTTAKIEGDKVTINGTKTFVTAGEESPYLLVIAKDEDPSPTNRNMSMWLMPTNTPGVSTSKLHKIGQQTATFTEMYFDDVVIPKSCLVGEQGKGFLQLMQNFEVERLLIASTSLGLAEAAHEDAVKYAAVRKAFGQEIYRFQLVAEHLTDAEIKLNNVRNYIYKTAWEHDNGISIRLSSALVKRYVPKACLEVADSAMQVLGGIGYTDDTRVSRIWKDLRGNRFAGGTDEIMVHIAGREIVKKYNK